LPVAGSVFFDTKVCKRSCRLPKRP